MNNFSGSITANLVFIKKRAIYYGKLTWEKGVITQIQKSDPEQAGKPYLTPGFIDPHVHIESSMLTPAEFGRQAVCHGTVATVSDPHEIANVLGIEGINFMLASAQESPCKIFYSAPSCVPATPFETTGASITVKEIDELFNEPSVVALSEMMDFPGVIKGSPEVLAKLLLAQQRGYPVDGHAPGVRGDAVIKYAQAGISTDHECFNIEEAQEKIAAGMFVQIREGSAARNFEALHTLITDYPKQVMLCSDDKHPDDLVNGHINQLAAKAVRKGHNIFDILQCICLNPIEHYKLPMGTLQIGHKMDAVLFNNIEDFSPLATYVSGEKVAEKGNCLRHCKVLPVINRFNALPITVEDIVIPYKGEKLIRVIKALEGELITHQLQLPPKVVEQIMESDTERDLLQVIVLNRYQKNIPPALAFINGFSLKHGAIASTVAHDSHNIIAVGCSRGEIVRAVNALIESGGGISVCKKEHVDTLPLPIAGLMSQAPAQQVAEQYAQMNQRIKQLGSKLRAPYMTLSFMALLVIPELKLSDKGLFDGKTFSFTSLSAN